MINNDCSYVRLYYDNGILHKEYFQINNKNGCIREGPYKEYYKNGQLQYELNYVDNQIHGLFKIYYENGILQKEINYINGKIEGQYKTYFSNGKLEQDVIFNDNNMITNYNAYAN